MSIHDFNHTRIPLNLRLQVDFTDGRHHVDVAYKLGRPIKHCPTASFLERGRKREGSKIILEKRDYHTREDDCRVISMDALLNRFKTVVSVIKY